jgi:hypothetical protein
MVNEDCHCDPFASFNIMSDVFSTLFMHWVAMAKLGNISNIILEVK